MIEEYKKQLKELKNRMIKAELFAERLPYFSKIILDNIYNEDDDNIDFGYDYKDLYCAWGIKRYLYKGGTSRQVTNYNNEHDCFLFSIYINTYNIYSSHDKHGLNDIQNECDVFFYDRCNSTFYATDEQVEYLLDKLVSWKNSAIIKNKVREKQKKIIELKKELNKLEGE